MLRKMLKEFPAKRLSSGGLKSMIRFRWTDSRRALNNLRSTVGDQDWQELQLSYTIFNIRTVHIIKPKLCSTVRLCHNNAVFLTYLVLLTS